MTLMIDPGAARQEAILDAAFGTFAAYGYRRATMEDIARAAGLSRTALYQHFRSKDDIFRSLTQHHFAQSLVAMEAALKAEGVGAEQALYGCFVAMDGRFMETVFNTPHGAELLDAGLSLNADLVREATARKAGVLAAWMDRRGLPAELEPAATLAGTVVAALMGLKSSARSVEDLRAGQAQLARLVARALDAD